jgi:nucleotide-binding universal stress UspA family protein
MYARIVVPLDGSELAEQALVQAEELSRSMNAPLRLVRVVDLTPLGRYGSAALYAEAMAYDLVRKDERTLSHSYLAEIHRSLTERGLSVTTEEREGPAARQIVAATRPGDVIVMATHGRGGLPRWLLGSVAEDVLRHATVPVLLVKVGAAPVAAPATASAVAAGVGQRSGWPAPGSGKAIAAVWPAVAND